MLEYESVQKWFEERARIRKPYKKGTKALYLNRIELICVILRANPDKIIETLKEAKDIDRHLWRMLEDITDALILSGTSGMIIINEILTTFGSFLRYNGITISDELRKHYKKRLSDAHHRGLVSFRKH